MAYISQAAFSNFLEKDCILIWISLKFVPKGPIDNELALVQGYGFAQNWKQVTKHNQRWHTNANNDPLTICVLNFSEET